MYSLNDRKAKKSIPDERKMKQNDCLNCGEPFAPRHPSKNYRAAYCSVQCWHEWQINHPEERFWRFVNKDGAVPAGRPDLGNCWLWTGAIQKGNPVFCTKRPKGSKARRFSYTVIGGNKLPEGWRLVVLCGEQRCVRHSHVEAVPRKEITRRSAAPTGENARKTHCKSGHELTPENLHPSYPNRRICKICRRRAAHRWYEQHRGATSRV